MTDDTVVRATEDEYRVGHLSYRRATRVDDQALQEILRKIPTQGWIQLTLERAPSYFAGAELMGRSTTVIARDTSRLDAVIGMYHCTQLPVMVNGQPTTCGYLGGLRINPDHRHRIRILKHGFGSVRTLATAHELPVWFTSIATDNHKARRLLEAGIEGLPRYVPLDVLETLAISTRRGKPDRRFRQATSEDIPSITAFYNRQASRYQFAPHLASDWLTGLRPDLGLDITDFCLLVESDSVRACVAVWDQRAFKQTVVRGYRFPLSIVRPLYNLAAYIRRKPLLPRKDNRIDSVFLAFLAIEPSARASAGDLLRAALYQANREKKATVGLLGLSARNALLPQLRDALRPESYRTCITRVFWTDEEAFNLNPSPVQPEIALL